MLTNFNNYYMYESYVLERDKPMVIDVDDITIDSFNEYFDGCVNILLDAPTPVSDEDIISKKVDINHLNDDVLYVSSTSILINFRDAIKVPLKPVDLLFNLAAWYAVIRTNQTIQPKHVLFDSRYMTKATIKNFMDKFIIPQTRKTFSNKDINAILDDTSYLFKIADKFSMWLMDTINLVDNIDLMNADPEFYNVLHADLSDISIEDYKQAGADLTNKAIERIMQSDKLMPYAHCLANAFRSKEGININQYKEFSIVIGTKPDGNGGVFGTPITTSFITGGVGDPLYLFIDSSAGRTAQILSKINVGSSGDFARLLGLNNTDTFLNPDPTYDCHTKNFQKFHVTTKEHLKRIMGRYYRLSPNGLEYYIGTDIDNSDLVGKTIYLRSPMTCASNSRGLGICYKCYGDLAYTNSNINIGKMAAEILSSKFTQRLLSAKHLLETIIKKVEWPDEFYKFFDIEGNAIRLQQDVDFKNYSIIIDPDNIDMEDKLDYKDSDEDDYYDDIYNEYITKFTIKPKVGPAIEIHSSGFDKMYLSNAFNNTIRKKATAGEGEKIVIPMNQLDKDDYIFYLVIHNNELSKTMEDIKSTINKAPVTRSMDKNQLLQTFVDTIIKGNLYVSSVHCETILSNQLRDLDNILDKPDWSYPNANYKVLTLNEALTNNPSIIISLMFQNLSKALYNPLSFKKNGASFIDLFFQENITENLEDMNEVIEGAPDQDGKGSVKMKPFYRVDTE